MTTEEMLARIAELEAENDRLKQQRVKKPEIFTEKMKKAYPWVERMRYRNAADTNLSKLVRSVCFPTVGKEHMHNYRDGNKKKINYNYVITLAEMSNSQLCLYNEVVNRILEILNDYETISKEESET